MAEVVKVDVEVLVERAQAGDLDALGQLYDRYRGRVAGLPAARPVPARTVVATLPARLGQVIDALLEPDPGDRLGSAEEVLGTLAALPSSAADPPWPGWATRLLDRPG